MSNKNNYNVYYHSNLCNVSNTERMMKIMTWCCGICSEGLSKFIFRHTLTLEHFDLFVNPLHTDL